jgi:hypothetical protein
MQNTYGFENLTKQNLRAMADRMGMPPFLNKLKVQQVRSVAAKFNEMCYSYLDHQRFTEGVRGQDIELGFASDDLPPGAIRITLEMSDAISRIQKWWRRVAPKSAKTLGADNNEIQVQDEPVIDFIDEVETEHFTISSTDDNIELQKAFQVLADAGIALPFQTKDIPEDAMVLLQALEDNENQLEALYTQKLDAQAQLAHLQEQEKQKNSSSDIINVELKMMTGISIHIDGNINDTINDTLMNSGMDRLNHGFDKFIKDAEGKNLKVDGTQTFRELGLGLARKSATIYLVPDVSGGGKRARSSDDTASKRSIEDVLMDLQFELRQVMASFPEEPLLQSLVSDIKKQINQFNEKVTQHPQNPLKNALGVLPKQDIKSLSLHISSTGNVPDRFKQLAKHIFNGLDINFTALKGLTSITERATTLSAQIAFVKSYGNKWEDYKADLLNLLTDDTTEKKDKNSCLTS